MLISFIHKTTELLRGQGRSSDDELAAPDDDSSLIAGELNRRTGDSHYCAVLAADSPSSGDEAELAAAWKSLEEHMALVPAGETTVITATIQGTGDNATCPQHRRVRVRAVYLDRHAVTNADYAAFVAAGGYRRAELWPPQILAQVLNFVDETGQPGPRFWSDGRPSRDKLDHPVVGLSWYEANAYSRWIGKRLPTPAEWQRAGCWSDTGSAERKYPWGEGFDPKLANTWHARRGDTAPVNDYYEGSTPNGVYQLVGNVWEWVAAAFECECQDENSRIVFEQPMAEIRGGAFDTYFENQATCQFRSGQPVLYRGANVGFRCCVSVDQLQAVSKPFAIH